MLNYAQECFIAWYILILCYDPESYLFLCNTQRRPAEMTGIRRDHVCDQLGSDCFSSW